MNSRQQDRDAFQKKVNGAVRLPITVRAFRKCIYDYYNQYGRDFPWRHTTSAYAILVSEIMLQQTQTDRVIEKYNTFLKRFPDIAKLARAHSASVLTAWQGLGYNRRALSLHAAARIIIKKYNGIVPTAYEALRALPGIGHYTACAIRAFAFNIPSVFIETNIRTVFIHFFFKNKNNIHDDRLIPLIEKTLDKKTPRKWYSALMDYGVMLKKHFPNPARKSRHYTKQSPFTGSNRQLRGKVLRCILNNKKMTVSAIIAATGDTKERVTAVVRQLEKECFIVKNTRFYTIK